MFERVQANPEYIIEDRKRMHTACTLNSVMNEKQGWRRKTGRLNQQLLNRKSSRAVKIRLGTSLSKEKKRRDKGEVPCAASSASASLQRVKGFPVATKDRSGRAQCQAKKTGNIEKTIAKATVNMEDGSEKQCSPPQRVEAKSNGALEGQNTLLYRTHGKST